MDTNALKKFAQSARNLAIDQVTAKLALVLDASSPVRREHPDAMKKLDAAIAQNGKQQVIEQVAYTWFNRFTALRFMDANGYTNPRVVSPADGATRPEILSEALAGNLPEGAPDAIAALLSGRTPSNDPQAEAYRLLLVHACNQWHGPMPFLFEQIDDFTELLMPEDLLSQTSILAELRKVMTPDACQDVEIIGWLYQFYISEKKDQVFAGLKKNVKITAENIPAATQLFTPHWIVRYLVENSLGRLWLLNRPASTLATKMDYYIAPVEAETDFLVITRPEDIRICDPAAGSGHMLTYAFDLLYAIYEEEGYASDTIPALILTHNLTGVEIDDRAGALAAFALVMKAAAKLGRRRFLRMGVAPDICVLQNVRFTAAEMQDVAAVVGRDLFTGEMRETLGQFEQAKNFGSLIIPKLRDPAEALRVVMARDFAGDLLLKDVQERVVAVLRMAEALSPKYHVVVANPPYAGSAGLNSSLKNWLSDNYPNSKADLMTSFMERCSSLSNPNSYWGMINLPTWVFTGSYASFRGKLLSNTYFVSLLELGRGVFGSDFGSVAFVMKNGQNSSAKGVFRRLFRNHFSVSGNSEIAGRFHDSSMPMFVVTSNDLKKIPGTPIAYWVSDTVRDLFAKNPNVESIADAKQGLATGENERFLRFWHEVSEQMSSLPDLRNHKSANQKKWHPYSKGGPARKWYGNLELVINWQGDGSELKSFKDKDGKLRSRPQNLNFQFREAATWSLTSVSSLLLCARWRPAGCLFDINGMSAFSKGQIDEHQLTALLSSRVSGELVKVLNPTFAFQSGDIAGIPLPEQFPSRAKPLAIALTNFSKSDWDAYETSWDFTTLPLLHPDHRAETMEHTYTALRSHWQGMTDDMQRLEEENNRIFIVSSRRGPS
jgi:hypothetical protein